MRWQTSNKSVKYNNKFNHICDSPNIEAVLASNAIKKNVQDKRGNTVQVINNAIQNICKAAFRILPDKTH